MSSRWLPAALLVVALLAGCSSGPSAPPVAEAPTSAAPSVRPPAPTAAPSTPDASSPAGAATAASPTAPATAAPTAEARRLARQDPPLEGEDVRAVQRRLLELGYGQVGQADGLYGPQTEAAVVAFQQLNGLEADGVIGPRTAARLNDPAATPAWSVVPVVEGLLCGSERMFMGASAGDAWFDNNAAGVMLRGGESYRLYDQSGPLGTATGAAVRLLNEPPFPHVYVTRLTPDLGQRGFIGVGGTWEPQPRQATALPSMPDRERAVSLVADYLRGAGIAKPVVTTGHVREPLQVDLDGDGQMELLISAERYEPATGAEQIAQDGYSVILLQHQAGGALKIEPIESDVYPGTSRPFDHESNSVFLVLDLNGDGRMEVVTRQHGFEWGGASAYGFAQGRVTRVLDAGCGV